MCLAFIQIVNKPKANQKFLKFYYDRAAYQFGLLMPFFTAASCQICEWQSIVGEKEVINAKFQNVFLTTITPLMQNMFAKFQLHLLITMAITV